MNPPVPGSSAPHSHGASARPVVIKAGGATLEDPGARDNLLHAIADLSRRPGGIVFVHGGGAAVDRHLDRLGMATLRREGIRITPPEQVEEIAGVLAGRFNKGVVAALNRAGARAVGLCLGDGGAIATRRATRYAFDAGRVGEVVVDAGDPGARGPGPGARTGPGDMYRVLIAAGFLPVVASIGFDEADGGFLNVNADDAASGIARALGAEALVLLTDVPGILDGRKHLVREADRAGIEAMIARGEITGGMIVKARAAADTAAAIGAPVVITSGTDAVAMRALASGEPAGTRVVAGSSASMPGVG